MRKLQLTLARLRFIPDGGKILGESGCDSRSPGCWDAAVGRSCVSHGARGVPGVPRGLCGSQRAAPRVAGGYYRLRTCGKLRQRRRQEPRVGARGARRPKREALRETPGRSFPRLGQRYRERRSIVGWAAGELLGSPRSRSAAPAGRQTAGQTDRSGGSPVSEYGLFKDDAQPTDAARPTQGLAGF